jgi:hypothetical protein
MAIASKDIKWAIVIARFKLMPQATKPDWAPMRDQRIADTFRNLSNPADWPGFFAEAFAATLQQEIMARGSFVPDLIAAVERFAGDGSKTTWAELEQHIDARVRDLQVG